MDGIINDRTTAFLIRSRLDYDMSTLEDFITENYTAVDCLEKKSNYIRLTMNGLDASSILSDFILRQITDTISDEVPDDVNLDDLISSNIDIFFDITTDMHDDDSVMVENAEIS